jgi:hypothetical protein
METRDNEPIIGVIFPVPERIISFMFENNRDIFVKYTSNVNQKTSEPKLKKGMSIHFYQSCSNKIIVGEATIEHAEYLNMDQIFRKYANRLFTTEDELRDYSKGREEKRALVLELTNFIKYKKAIQLSTNITMSGLYITEKRKTMLFDEK